MRELCVDRPRFGCPRIHLMLRREGFAVNHKRTHRIYVEEKLQIRRRRKRKVAGRAPREAVATPSTPHVRWSMDFVSDSLHDGRTIRVLNVIDDCSRYSVAQEVDFSLPGERAGRVLDRAATRHGRPQIIVMDYGPEFTSKALDRWAWERGVKLHFIESGKPIQNAFVESFNGKFPEECLGQNWFTSLDHARAVIAEWRDDYNHVRPHSSLADCTPASVEAAASNPPGRLLLNGASLNEQEDGEHVPVVTNPADPSKVQV